jgi:hypothetical protein
VRWQNSGSFACEAVARVLGQANVPECAVGILFLSFILFTVVVFLALAVTFCSYPKLANSKHFTVNQAETLIEAQNLI